jgi:Pentapeptide repeats (9 copies)
VAEPWTYNRNGKEVTIADPEGITRDECLALAKCGKDAWNAWRREFGTVLEKGAKDWKNRADFSNHDFCETHVNFSGFEFGDTARFDETKFSCSVNFDGAQFGYSPYFQGVQFRESVSFKKARFGGATSFNNAQFAAEANFDEAYFEGGTGFSEALFESWASFNRAVFENGGSFSTTHFGGIAYFDGSQFGESTLFYGADFRAGASFIGAQFEGQTFFDGARFGHEVSFDGAQFGRWTGFTGVQFDGRVSFAGHGWHHLSGIYRGMQANRQAWATARGLSPECFGGVSWAGANFVGEVDISGRRFEGATVFGRLAEDLEVKRPKRNARGAVQKDESGKLVEEGHITPAGTPSRFGSAPNFHESKLHQDTSFDGAEFPRSTGNEVATRAYRTLKLAFAQQQANRQEQLFFKLEMAEEAKAAENSKDPRRWLYIAYRELADFGFSVKRPALLLLMTTLLAMAFYAWQAGLTMCVPWSAQCRHTAPLLQFGLASALPGFEKLAEPAAISLFGKANGVADFGAWTVITLLLQKGGSLLALFLIGLALRNLFKMK